MSQGIDEGIVDVYMPAHPEALVLARLQVAALGRIVELDVDEIGDLRLAVEELCLLVLAQPREHRGRLHLSLGWHESSIEVSCCVEEDDVAFGADDWRADYPGDLSAQILDALVDEHGVEGESGAKRAWLRKKRSSS